MNFSSLPPCPTAFKSINPYLQRAKEMERVDPVISYWCTFHAAQTCMSIGHNEVESREFLMRLLDLLEHVKSQLSDNDAITNNLAATAYVENFALKIFDGADMEDQQGLSTRITAQRFLAAACFLEVLQSLTNQPESDIIQKIKYSKWKAGSIAKAMREGTGSQQNWEIVGHQPSPGSVSSSEAIVKTLAPEKSATSSQPMSSNEKMDDDWPKELGTSSINKLPSPTSVSNSNPFSSQSLQSNKPSPFPSTVFPPNQTVHHLNNLNSVGSVRSDSTVGNKSLGSNHLSRFPVPPTHSYVDPSPSAAPTQPIQQTFYSTPSSLNNNNSTQNGHHQNTNTKTEIMTISNLPLNSSSIIDSNSSALLQSTEAPSLDFVKISKAQKHAKWAISALEFDDISTAKNQLQTALDTLNSI